MKKDMKAMMNRLYKEMHGIIILCFISFTFSNYRKLNYTKYYGF